MTWFDDGDLARVVAEYKERPSFPDDGARTPERRKTVTIDDPAFASMAEELLLRRKAMRDVANAACLGEGQLAPPGQMLSANIIRLAILDGQTLLRRDGYEPLWAIHRTGIWVSGTAPVQPQITNRSP